MSMKDEIRDFLISRRANITPEQAGLPTGGGERRVPGLRREEVALLAGVSSDYYTKLERGKIRNASDSVLTAIARALHLDDVERAHLFDLARPTRPVPTISEPRTPAVRDSIRRVLQGMTVPALVYNTTHDIVASNLLGRAMFAPIFDSDRPNLARFIFLDSRAPGFYGDWPLACSLTAAMIRYEAGRDPLNSELTALIGELSTRSPQFRRSWAEQDVHEHRTGAKVFHHNEVGDLDVTYDVLELPGEPGLSITTYSAVENSPTAEKFVLLASWAASQDFTTHPTRTRII
ncbi:transcriptional regulator [Rhodococcus opacus]|uniref:Transcriptional regulator n=2 Tax=Rhodococcus opacus TaxID=37919 RepID=A0A2S8IIB9_RHOOP|nr:helix-turn-helix transcriptional regulator [Rhodococcus opacus]PQP14503.1 transcriptional regulator [Rhodococcus opacus]